MRSEGEVDTPNRFHRRLLALVCLAFVATAGWYSIQIPAGEGVDETPHFAYVQFIKEQRALPIQPMERKGVEVWMGHHPPLYYLLGGLVTSWIDTSDFQQALRPNPHFVWAENSGSNGWNVMLHFGQDLFPWRGAILALHVMRWLSVAFGMVAVIAIYNTTRYLLPDYRWAPLGATSLVAFNPSFLFMSSTVHHDVLLTAIYSLGLWWAARAVKVPLHKRDLWIGGLLAGAAALTKLSGVTLVAVMGLALVLKGWPSRDWREVAKQILHLAGVALLVSSWWYIRNQILYGDPLGWQMFLSIHRHMVRADPYTWRVFWHEFVGQIGRTFWGAFGFMHITFPDTTRYLWWASGLAMVGLGVAMARRRRPVQVTPALLAWLVVLSGLALILVSFVRFSVATVGAGHGRYLFPAAPAIAAILVAGFNGFSNWRHQRGISVMLAVGMLAYAVWMPVALVLPKYDTPEMAASEDLGSVRPGDWVFGDAIRLVGYDIEPALAIPDSWLAVRLYWQATGPATERPDVYAYARLVTEEGELLHSVEFWPAESTTPAVWAEGETYVSQAALRVPAEGHAGQLYAEIILALGQGGAPLSASQSAGAGEADYAARLGPIPAVGQVVEVPHEAVVNRRREVLGPIALAGHALPEEPLTPGEPMIVQLFWHVLDIPSVDYTVFVHVLDEQGQLVTQFDRQPGGGTSPTSSWEGGQTLLDTYPVPVPEGLPAGNYTVHVGMYTWPSLERQQVSIDGVPAGDSVLLGSVQVY
jgi:4-amino-4-deoxy-L-arabinose transferase-like glycosyltransferase